MKIKNGTTAETPVSAKTPAPAAAKAPKAPKATTKTVVKVSAKTAPPKAGRVSEREIIALRTLKFKHPEMAVQALKDKTGIALNIVTIGRTLRGLIHANVDMCGLPVRPYCMEPRTQTAPKPKTAETPKAKKTAKAA